jgi:hypothetical protein
VYEGLEFLKNQIDFMKTPDFRQRPTAQLALQRWQETKGKLDIATARWRLRERDEPVGLRVMRDAVSVVQKGLTRILNPQASPLLFSGLLCEITPRNFSNRAGLGHGQILDLGRKIGREKVFLIHPTDKVG